MPALPGQRLHGADGVVDLLADVEHDRAGRPRCPCRRGPARAASRRGWPAGRTRERSRAARVLSGWSTWRYSALARITASGVRSSCDASATNVRWCSNASCTGASDLPARNQPPIAASTRPARPPTNSAPSRFDRASRSGLVERATWMMPRNCPRALTVVVYTRHSFEPKCDVRMSVPPVPATDRSAASTGSPSWASWRSGPRSRWSASVRSTAPGSACPGRRCCRSQRRPVPVPRSASARCRCATTSARGRARRATTPAPPARPPALPRTRRSAAPARG